MFLLKWFLKSTKRHCVAIFTIVIIDVVLTSFWYQNQRAFMKEVYEKNIGYGILKCEEAVNELDHIISFGENIVNHIDQDYHNFSEINNMDVLGEKLVKESNYLIDKNTDYGFKIYIAYDGKLISSDSDEYETFNPVGRLWYDQAINSGNSVITNPYEDIDSNENVVTVSKKIGNSNNVVGLDIAQEEISNVLKDGLKSDKVITTGFIINQEGIFIARTDDKYMGLSAIDQSVEYANTLKPYFQELLKNKSGKIMFEQDGYAYALVYQKTASDWNVVYAVNEKIVNSENVAYKKQVMFTYLVSLFLLDVIVLVYYTKRLKANDMKDRAEKSERYLIEYKDNLEQMVVDRTEKIRIQGERLEEFNTIIIENLADIVEFRDLESGQHIKRIKKFVYLLVKKATELYPEYDIYKDKIDVLCNASALHDIGKIGIPDRILLKPSKLTFEEFEQMKDHTIIGEEIATRILEKYDADLAKIGSEICKYHHERYDGKGYPEGLKGEEIPFCAQIVGIADVYDALIEKRVYKEAFSHETAIAMIKRGECGVFSEKLIFCLELVVDEFLEISTEIECYV